MKIAEIEAGGKSIPELLKTYFSINRHYNIIDGDLYNGIIDVDGNVSLIKRISKLPVQFGSVGGDFYCQYNKLTTLEGAPTSVGSVFYCNNNQLITLQGAPSSVGGSFSCSGNNLTTLEGAPKSVGGDFYCHYNKLTTLKGAPSSVGSVFYCAYNDNLPLLRLLLIKNINKIEFLKINNIIVENILNKYLGQGKAGALQCAAELAKAGFKGNARL
jgi:hypothetical protein